MERSRSLVCIGESGSCRGGGSGFGLRLECLRYIRAGEGVRLWRRLLVFSVKMVSMSLVGNALCEVTAK